MILVLFEDILISLELWLARKIIYFIIRTTILHHNHIHSHIYGQVAERNGLRFIPAVFSHTGQIHEAFKIFVKEQIRFKLEAFEGEAKRSKVRSYMNWWVKCISAVIVKTASRNVAFKATRMRDSIMDGQDQDKFIIWKIISHQKKNSAGYAYMNSATLSS